MLTPKQKLFVRSYLCIGTDINKLDKALDVFARRDAESAAGPLGKAIVEMRSDLRTTQDDHPITALLASEGI